MNTDPRLTLIEAAQQFYHLGWMVGTAGNLSIRMPDNTFWITASGKSKGKLKEDDFVRVDLEGKLIESPHSQNCPSAETSIHQAIYSLFPDANACYHVHSIEANLISRFAENNDLSLPAIEMLKGLGIWTENPKISMPVFANYCHVPEIAQTIRERFQILPPDVPALLILDHGVTVWGHSPEQAQNYLEVSEYLFRYLIAERQLR
jgi:methylthioribulose-1-phosphate dehydratase